MARPKRNKTSVHFKISPHVLADVEASRPAAMEKSAWVEVLIECGIKWLRAVAKVDPTLVMPPQSPYKIAEKAEKRAKRSKPRGSPAPKRHK